MQNLNYQKFFQGVKLFTIFFCLPTELVYSAKPAYGDNQLYEAILEGDEEKVKSLIESVDKKYFREIILLEAEQKKYYKKTNTLTEKLNIPVFSELISSLRDVLEEISEKDEKESIKEEIFNLRQEKLKGNRKKAKEIRKGVLKKIKEFFKKNKKKENSIGELFEKIFEKEESIIQEAYVNEQTYYTESTPLYYAAAIGNEKICSCLLKKGAFVNAQNKYGSTPLHISAFKGNIEVCKVLLKHKAYINMEDNYEKTPMYMAKKTNQNEIIRIFKKLSKEGKNNVKSLS